MILTGVMERSSTEGHLVWCHQCPPAFSRATSAGEAGTATALGLLCCHGMQGIAVLTDLQGQMERGKKVSLPQRVCVWGLHPALAPSLSIAQVCHSLHECSAHLETGGRRALGASGGSGCLCTYPASIHPCHAFSLWRLNCFFQVIFPCSASLYFQYFNAPLNHVPTSSVVSSTLEHPSPSLHFAVACTHWAVMGHSQCWELPASAAFRWGERGKAVSTGTWGNVSLPMEHFGSCSQHSLTRTSWKCSCCCCCSEPWRLMWCWWDVDQELPSVSHLPWLSHPSHQLLGLDPGLSGEGLEWCLDGSYHGWLLSSPM